MFGSVDKVKSANLSIGYEPGYKTGCETGFIFKDKRGDQYFYSETEESFYNPKNTNIFLSIYTVIQILNSSLLSKP
jgi:hypothetical protein